MKILAIDIGNTSTSLAVMSGQRMLRNDFIDYQKNERSFCGALLKVIKTIHRQHPQIEKCVICSVVPSKSQKVKSTAKRVLKVKTSIVGRDIKVPIKNKYRNPRQVGQDRLVGAYAAQSLYGRPTIIIDFGTAITFDVVSPRGDYEGGIIVPGIRLTAESLFKKTAMLPRIETIKKPKSLVGKDTKDSILSGIFYGYGAMSQGLIDQISKKLKKKPKIIVTGGYTHLMKNFISRKITKVDRGLVFKGMALLARLKQY